MLWPWHLLRDFLFWCLSHGAGKIRNSALDLAWVSRLIKVFGDQLDLREKVRASRGPALEHRQAAPGKITATVGPATGVQRGPADLAHPTRLLVRRLCALSRHPDVTCFDENYRRAIWGFEGLSLRALRLILGRAGHNPRNNRRVTRLLLLGCKDFVASDWSATKKWRT